MNTQMIDNKEKKLSAQFPQEVPNEVIESQTKKIPNLVFLGLAGVSLIGSAIMAFRGKKTDYAVFIGQWVPSFLLFGLYNKMVKVEDELLSNSKSSSSLH